MIKILHKNDNDKIIKKNKMHICKTRNFPNIKNENDERK